MTINDPQKPRTPAQRQADQAFKSEPLPEKKLSHEQETRKLFDDNRERLKAERLAREQLKKQKD
jgi:hypothetical protein